MRMTTHVTVGHLTVVVISTHQTSASGWKRVMTRISIRCACPENVPNAEITSSTSKGKKAVQATGKQKLFVTIKHRSIIMAFKLTNEAIVYGNAIAALNTELSFARRQVAEAEANPANFKEGALDARKAHLKRMEDIERFITLVTSA